MSGLLLVKVNEDSGYVFEKAAVRIVQDTACSGNILPLIIIFPKFYSFVNENHFSRTQS